jgi:hypothetical protein
MEQLTSEQMSAIAGIILSLALSYVPGLRAWFAAIPSDYKRLIVLILLIIVSGAAFGLSCGGVIQAVACTQEGALGLITSFVAALVANQAAYTVSPEPEDVRSIKAGRG